VLSGEDSSGSSLPTDISTIFVPGLSEKGPIDKPSVATSFGQFKNVAGDRTGNSMLWDYVDSHFQVGGAKVVWVRETGDAPKAASGKLAGASTDSLQVTATSVGEWANDLDFVVTVVETTKRKLVVKLDSVVVQERTFATNEEAVSWASTSPYFRLADLGGGLPKAATLELTGGTDDRESADDTNLEAALKLITADYGPGKVVLPGHTTTSAQAIAQAHAETHGRTTRLDGINGTKAEAISSATTLRALGTARYGGLFWPWAVVKGIAPGTTRTVPYSAIDTGMAARNAALGYTPNDATAGDLGIAPEFVLELSQPALTDDEREEMNDAGVNVAREMLGGVRTYGYRTLVNPLLDDTWLDLANADTDAFIKAKCKAIGERFVFKTIDGKGRLAARFASMIEGEVLGPLYDADALFGETPDEAYEVRVGSDVNTPETIAEGKLRAIVLVKMSEFAEQVEIEITKEAI
jgi:phage tail sheath protein FI